MIKYEEFVKELKERLMVRLQLPEEKIYLCRKGEKYAETGDRLVIECVESEKEVGALGIYIKELYEEDPREETISICGHISKIKKNLLEHLNREFVGVPEGRGFEIKKQTGQSDVLISSDDDKYFLINDLEKVHNSYKNFF